jgi:hypothetical protein
VRVAGAVPALVMLLDRVGPRSEPGGEGCSDARTTRRVALEDRPLFLCRLLGLVENRRGDVQLADVVQQRRPAKPVAVVLGESQLFSDEVVEGADAF